MGLLLLAAVLVSKVLAELMMMSNIRPQQLNYQIVVVVVVDAGGGAVDSGVGGSDNVKH